MVSAHGVEVLMQSLGVGSADDDREFVAAHAATVLINLSTEEPFKTAVVRGNVVKESLKPLVSGYASRPPQSSTFLSPNSTVFHFRTAYIQRYKSNRKRCVTLALQVANGPESRLSAGGLVHLRERAAQRRTL